MVKGMNNIEYAVLSTLTIQHSLLRREKIGITMPSR